MTSDKYYELKVGDLVRVQSMNCHRNALKGHENHYWEVTGDKLFHCTCKDFLGLGEAICPKGIIEKAPHKIQILHRIST